jgi:hypothetical protein
MLTTITAIALAVAWKIPVWIAAATVAEWVIHRCLLHGKWIHDHVPSLAFVYERHAIEHHGRKHNELFPHIDLVWTDYLFCLPFLIWNIFRTWKGDTEGGLSGLLSMGLVLGTHWYLWNHWHRAIHGLETGHWTTRLPMYAAVRHNHDRHHRNWRTALNVVCIFGEILPAWASRKPRVRA